MSKTAGFFIALSAFLAGFIIGSRAQGGEGGIGCGNKINNVINWSFRIIKGN